MGIFAEAWERRKQRSAEDERTRQEEKDTYEQARQEAFSKAHTEAVQEAAVRNARAQAKQQVAARYPAPQAGYRYPRIHKMQAGFSGAASAFGNIDRALGPAFGNVRPRKHTKTRYVTVVRQKKRKQKQYRQMRSAPAFNVGKYL
jgi:outer membrane protein TolC